MKKSSKHAIKYAMWTQDQRDSIQGFLVNEATKYSRKFKFFTPDDLYVAGFCGYLEATEHLTWTIHNDGMQCVRARITGAILDEIKVIYGRQDTQKGRAQIDAKIESLQLPTQVNLSDPNAALEVLDGP